MVIAKKWSILCYVSPVDGKIVAMQEEQDAPSHASVTVTVSNQIDNQSIIIFLNLVAEIGIYCVTGSAILPTTSAVNQSSNIHVQWSL